MTEEGDGRGGGGRRMNGAGGISPPRRGPRPAWLEFAAAAVLLGLLGWSGAAGFALPLPALAVAGGVLAVMCALLACHWPHPARALGAANRVTLARAVLVALLAGALAAPAWARGQAPLVAALAALALLLDGVDGWVARRLRCESAFGARFDMEVDAFLILVLCAHLLVLGKAAAWVLAIGAMRYVFAGAMLWWPWLDRPLPPSTRRKGVCVWQVASLLSCLLPFVAGALATALLALALALLVWSFAVDVRWLHGARRRETVRSS